MRTVLHLSTRYRDLEVLAILSGQAPCESASHARTPGSYLPGLPTFVPPLRRALYGCLFLWCAVLPRGGLRLLLRSRFLPLYAETPLQCGFEQLLLRNGHRSM